MRVLVRPTLDKCDKSGPKRRFTRGVGRAGWPRVVGVLSGLAACLLSLVLLACGARQIPNTDVEDTELNRDVIRFCETYRKAVERRNVGLLLQMADPRYYEDGGNIDPTDDLDYEGLGQYLKDQFQQTKAIRYEIRYRRVSRGRADNIQVDFTYSASYKIPTEQGDVWRRTVADNRLVLVPHKETYRILSGM
jgi:hypothetical protein